MEPSNSEWEPQFQLSQFEPDPDGFEGCPDLGFPVEALDWLTWTDSAHELSWAEIEAPQITPRVPTLTWSGRR